MTDIAVMGIVNVTPDSFSDGGQYFGLEAAVAHGVQLLRDGADILDVGGEATNPRAAPVTADEELRRVLPVVEQLAAAGAIVSIDTTKAVVARAAVAAGARIINDISGGLFDPEMYDAIGDATYIIGHLRGRSIAEVFAAEAPGRLTQGIDERSGIAGGGDRAGFAGGAGVFPRGIDERSGIAGGGDRDGFAGGAGVFPRGINWRTVADELAERLAALPVGARERAWVDPGLGFGKGADPEANLALLRHSGDLGARLGRPVVVGPSRKRFIRRAFGVGDDDLAALDAASVTASLDAIRAGANVVRVHNVALLRAALTLYTKH